MCVCVWGGFFLFSCSLVLPSTLLPPTPPPPSLFQTETLSRRQGWPKALVCLLPLPPADWPPVPCLFLQLVCLSLVLKWHFPVACRGCARKRSRVEGRRALWSSADNFRESSPSTTCSPEITPRSPPGLLDKHLSSPALCPSGPV